MEQTAHHVKLTTVQNHNIDCTICRIGGTEKKNYGLDLHHNIHSATIHVIEKAAISNSPVKRTDRILPLAFYPRDYCTDKFGSGLTKAYS